MVDKYLELMGLSGIKDEWPIRDAEWFVPNKKRPIAYSSVASRDTIDMFVQMGYRTPKQLLSLNRAWGEDEKKVFNAYIQNGYGDLDLRPDPRYKGYYKYRDLPTWDKIKIGDTFSFNIDSYKVVNVLGDIFHYKERYSSSKLYKMSRLDFEFYVKNATIIFYSETKTPLHGLFLQYSLELMKLPDSLSGLRAPYNSSPYINGKRMMIGDLFWYNGDWYIITNFDHSKGITYVIAANKKTFAATTSSIKESVKDGSISSYDQGVTKQSPLRSLWTEQVLRTIK